MITFKEFYAAYPRHVAPADAEKAWGQVLKKGITPERIMLDLEIMKTTEWKDRKPDFVPYPASWLRGSFTKDTISLFDAPPPPPKPAPAHVPFPKWQGDKPPGWVPLSAAEREEMIRSAKEKARASHHL